MSPTGLSSYLSQYRDTKIYSERCYYLAKQRLITVSKFIVLTFVFSSVCYLIKKWNNCLVWIVMIH